MKFKFILLMLFLSSCAGSSHAQRAENITFGAIALTVLIYVMVAMKFGKSVSP